MIGDRNKQGVGRMGLHHVAADQDRWTGNCTNHAAKQDSLRALRENEEAFCLR